MRQVHIAFVSAEHCDIAADLAAVTKYRLEHEFTADENQIAQVGGIAYIPIHGMLMNRFPGSVGFATGYDFIRGQLHQALDDPDVAGIVFDINSAGGMTTGCGELADEIYRSRERKPSVAVIDGNCYSAAYYLGSAASRVMCTPSSGIGSIGTLAMHIDASKQLEQEGITVTLIHAGEAKVDGNPFQPLSDRAKERIEAAVQYHYGMFTDSVARFRGIPVEDVRATEAGCYTPPEALALGLIDGVGVSADAIMTIVGAGGGMSESISQDEVARISAQAAAQAVADDRARASAIRNSPDAQGREKLADHLAFSTAMSVEEACGVLANAPKQEAPTPQANVFSAAMESTGNPNVGPDNAGNTVGGSTADRVLANYGAVTGYAYRKTA
jgi:signal peptide peptidase SppA